MMSEGKIKWVAIEALPSNFEMGQLAQWNEFDEKLLKKLEAKGVSANLFQQMRAYYWGPIIDDYLNKASWATRPLIGFDSSFVKEWNLQFDEANAIAQNHLNGSPHLTPEHFARINEISKKLEYSDVLPTHDEILTLVRPFPSALREPLITFFSKLKQGREVSFLRDAIAAENLLQLEDDGLVIMGDAHRENMIRELTKLCIQMASQKGVLPSSGTK